MATLLMTSHVERRGLRGRAGTTQRAVIIKGRYLPSLYEAQQMAELIAMDLSCTRVDGASPMEVQIRDAKGCLLISVAVQLPDAIAA